MKTCFKCNVEKELSEFHNDRRTADGRVNKCKTCACADSIKHRNDNIEHYISYDRMRSKTEPRKTNRKIYLKNYCKNHPDRELAKNAIKHAITSGKIQKEPCIVCGTLENLQAHHHDYSKPLDVIWYCAFHHRQIHGKKR